MKNTITLFVASSMLLNLNAFAQEQTLEESLMQPLPQNYFLENYGVIRAEQDRQYEEKLDKEWMFNPLSQYISREDWNEVLNETLDNPTPRKNEDRQFQKAQVITVDTRDQKACQNVQEQFVQLVDEVNDDLENLCEINHHHPYASFVYITKKNINPINYDSLNERERELVKQTRNFMALGVGMMGILYAMPESVTKWNKDEFKAENIKYFDNIKEGPVWDKDDWAINYIGHPYSGAIYYRVARHAGFNRWESFGYSAFMSTFFWEYGMEAFAEVPSIQDLLITPTIGALLGEAFIHWEQKIEQNGGKLLGSETLGSVAMGFMDPGKFLLNAANNLFENKFIKSSEFFYYMGIDYGVPNAHLDPFQGRPQIGFGLELKF